MKSLLKDALILIVAVSVFKYCSSHPIMKPTTPKFKVGDCIVIDDYFEGMIYEFLRNGKDYGFMYGTDVAYCDSVDRLNDVGGAYCSISNYDIEYTDKHAKLRKCRAQ